MHQNISRENLRFGRMMVYAGAVMSLMIGAAFATGQEVLMYFVAWGNDMFAIVGIILAIIIWISLSFSIAGSRHHFQKMRRYSPSSVAGTSERCTTILPHFSATPATFLCSAA